MGSIGLAILISVASVFPFMGQKLYIASSWVTRVTRYKVRTLRLAGTELSLAGGEGSFGNSTCITGTWHLHHWHRVMTEQEGGTAGGFLAVCPRQIIEPL